MADVLLIGRDPDLVDHLLALASAAELSVQVEGDPREVTLVWTRSPLVVVCADVLEHVVLAALPARPGLVVFGGLQEHQWRTVFDLGVQEVVEPPGEPGWLSERVAGAGEETTARGAVIGVVGSRGGAGTSVFACALALAGVRAAQSTYLLDLDPLGCGLAVVLGADRVEGLTWDHVRSGAGRIPVRSLDSALTSVEGVAVLGWPDDGTTDLPPGVAASVVDTARRSAGVTILDLGRAVTDYQREAMARCDRVFLLVPADVRSVRSAQRTVARLGTSFDVVVRGPNPGGLTGADVADAIGVPVVAAMAADRGLDQRLERGEPPGYRRRTPLARAGDGLLAEVLR